MPTYPPRSRGSGRALATTAVLIGLVGGLAGVASATSAATETCSIDYRITTEWHGGYIGAVELTYSGPAVDDWTLEFQLPEGETITSGWNGTYTQVGTTITVDPPSWKPSLAPGDSIAPGFVAGDIQVVSEPTSFTVNGQPCSSNSPSSPGPSDPVTPAPPSDDDDDDDDFDYEDLEDFDIDDVEIDDLDDLNAIEMSRVMGTGWNLTNTLEAYVHWCSDPPQSWCNPGAGDETVWCNPKATPELFQAVKAAGFDNVHIPVAWVDYSDESTYTINPAWLDRVEEVVNYALDAGLYVMINEHSNQFWLNGRLTYDEQDAINEELGAIWRQVATRFRDYDHRLLFAGVNEVHQTGSPNVRREYLNVQNSLAQTFVDTVRSTGGNNEDRFLVVQSYGTNIDRALSQFTMPTDTEEHKLLIEVHYYAPFNFTLNNNGDLLEWPSDKSPDANENLMDAQMDALHEKYVRDGVGVILGEFGVRQNDAPGFQESRIRWWSYLVGAAVRNDIVPQTWDFALFDRHTTEHKEPEIIKAIIDAGQR